MDKGLAVRSLVSYLDQSRHPFVIKLAFPKQPTVDPENLSDPFVILYDSDPLTRVYLGKMVTNTGVPIKDLFLLIQRDSYPRSNPSLRNLTNKAVDGLWQEAFHLPDSTGGSRIVWISQLNERETILPFESLFYCAFRDLYFRPVCPGCGGSLGLCRNDEILEAGGLSPYSSSLDRYLYCPSCSKSAFYVPQKSESAPPSLLDTGDLIEAFAQVTGDVSGDFPCATCPEKGGCYGAGGQALQRIFPFSFFPFHLLAFDAFPTDVMDFQRLVSGRATDVQIAEPPIQEVSVPEVPMESSVAPSEATEAALTKLLLNIREKWQAQLENDEKEEAAPEEIPKEAPQEIHQPVMEARVKPSSEPVLEKTMIFSPAEMGNMASTGEDAPKKETPRAAPPKPPPLEAQLEKTMIFSPDSIPVAPSTPPPEPPVSEDQLAKTVIQGPDNAIKEETEHVKPKKKAEIIPETIIMPLDDLKGKKRDE